MVALNIRHSLLHAELLNAFLGLHQR
jgi:hypothetical protein